MTSTSTAPRASSRPRPTARSGIEEEFAILDPAHARPRAALRGAARRRGATDPVLADSIAGELISSEIEIRSGRGEDLADAVAPPARRARAPVRARRRPRRRARARPAPTRGPTTASSRTSTPSTTAASSTGLQYVARRNNTFSLHVHVGVRGIDRAVARLRPPAPGPAAAAGRQRQLAVPRRPRHAGCTPRAPRSSRSASRAAAIPDAYGSWAAYRDYLELLVAHGLDRRVHAGVVVGAPALRLRHGRGAHLRRAGHRGGVRGARGADRRLRAAGRARRRRGPAPARPAAAPGRGEPVARDPLRPGRAA